MVTALGQLAPATHGAMVAVVTAGAATWFPEVATVDRAVVLRRHAGRRERLVLAAGTADPEIARLARYQGAPMRAEEIERFFAARVVGPDALAMAIHERGDRAPGRTCAFSQLDGDNGSASTTSRSARRTPGAGATAPRRPG